jgi:integrase/recombinase XerD
MKNEVTFGFELGSHPNEDGMYSVMLRLTQNRAKKRIKTDLKVKKSDWNQKAKKYDHFRSSDNDAEINNQKLLDIICKYKAVYQKLREEGIATPENIIDHIQNGYTSESFMEYAKERTQAIHDEGRISDWKKNRTFLSKLEAYLDSINKKDLLFAEITPTFLTRFNNFLHNLHNEREPELRLHENYIEVQLRTFKKILNKAITIDGAMKSDQNPFWKFQIHHIKTVKEKLTKEEIKALEDVALEEGSARWNSRNCFLFSYYCAGIRIGDLLKLRWCNIQDGRLVYEMDKTHENRSIQLEQNASNILRMYAKKEHSSTDYIFPFLGNISKSWMKYTTHHEIDTMSPEMKEDMYKTISSKTAIVNKNLSAVAKLANIEKKVTTHIARHSFAKRAKEAGIDNLAVKKLLGHSKLETTEKYMGEFDTEETDKAMNQIFSTKPNKESIIEQLRMLDANEREELFKQFSA